MADFEEYPCLFGSICKFYFWLQSLITKVRSQTNRVNCILLGARDSKKSRQSRPDSPQLGTRVQQWRALGTTRWRAASSRHLLVQDEVEVESPIASWSPILATSSVSGAHEHERSHAESPQARAQAPRAVHATAGALASLASAGPQGLAIRGPGLPSGPLAPWKRPEAIVQKSSRVSLWFPPVLRRGFGFQGPQGALLSGAAGFGPSGRSQAKLEALQSKQFRPDGSLS